MITTDIINEQSFDENSEAEEVTWDICTLRKYLNGNFLQTFNSNELGQILDTVNTNDGNKQFGTDGGDKTTDKVFILSIEEAEKHFNNNESRMSKLNDTFDCWWLRSPGETAINAAIVDDTGAIDFNGQCVDFKCGIRPVLWRVMS